MTIYLTKEQTGLPFDVVKDEHFHNYYAQFENNAKQHISAAELINIHLLIELRNIQSAGPQETVEL